MTAADGHLDVAISVLSLKQHHESQYSDITWTVPVSFVKTHELRSRRELLILRWGTTNFSRPQSRPQLILVTLSKELDRL